MKETITCAFLIQMILCKKYVCAEKCHWEPCKYPTFSGKEKPAVTIDYSENGEGAVRFLLCAQRHQVLRSSVDRREGMCHPEFLPHHGSLEAWRPRPCLLAIRNTGDSCRPLGSYQHVGSPLYYLITPAWGYGSESEKHLCPHRRVECGLGGQKDPVPPLSSQECWSCQWKGSQKNTYF